MFIISMTKLLDVDWLRGVQLFINYISSVISGKCCNFIGLQECDLYRKLHGLESIPENHTRVWRNVYY